MPDDLENLPLAVVSNGKVQHWQIFEIPKWIFFRAFDAICRRSTTETVIPLPCSNPENVKIAVKKR